MKLYAFGTCSPPRSFSDEDGIPPRKYVSNIGVISAFFQQNIVFFQQNTIFFQLLVSESFFRFAVPFELTYSFFMHIHMSSNNVIHKPNVFDSVLWQVQVCDCLGFPFLLYLAVQYSFQSQFSIPTPVQLQILERIFDQGNRTLSKQKIKDITTELSQHGRISLSASPFSDIFSRHAVSLLQAPWKLFSSYLLKACTVVLLIDASCNQITSSLNWAENLYL